MRHDQVTFGLEVGAYAVPPQNRGHRRTVEPPPRRVRALGRAARCGIRSALIALPRQIDPLIADHAAQLAGLLVIRDRDAVLLGEDGSEEQFGEIVLRMSATLEKTGRTPWTGKTPLR